MTDVGLAFDPVWEELYANGKHLNKYPFNNVPNFFFHYVPRDKPRCDVKVMEVGFGAGNNLWLCAREGAQVYGVDAAPSGVRFAKKRFEIEGLPGDLTIGDFCDLPYADNSFDMIINRQALSHVAHSSSKLAVQEIYRCLNRGGHFWSNMFSDRTDRVGTYLGDGLWDTITEGPLVNVGQTSFHSRQDIEDMYGDGWEILELIHQDNTRFEGNKEIHCCEWYVVARNAGN